MLRDAVSVAIRSPGSDRVAASEADLRRCGMIVTFDALGEPVTQGSMRAFVRNGHPVVTHGRALHLGVWRGVVGAAAMAACGERPPLEGAVSVRLAFTFRRPATHLGAHDVLPRHRKAVPNPDVDKLARAVLDALTGIAFVDDRQVVELVATKAFGDRAGVAVTIETSEVEVKQLTFARASA